MSLAQWAADGLPASSRRHPDGETGGGIVRVLALGDGADGMSVRDATPVRAQQDNLYRRG